MHTRVKDSASTMYLGFIYATELGGETDKDLSWSSKERHDRSHKAKFQIDRIGYWWQWYWWSLMKNWQV